MLKQKPLEKLFKFTDDELELNRHGQLSQRQRQRLKLQESGYVFAVLGVVVALGIAVSSPLLASNTPGWAFVVLLLCVMPLFGLAFLIVGIPWYSLYKSLKDPQPVAADEGPIKAEIRYSGKVIKGVLSIGAKTYTVPLDSVKWLQNGQQFRIYYLRYSGVVLSLEELPALDTLLAQ